VTSHAATSTGDPPVSTPIRLSDDQLAELMRLAQPLAPPCRDAFLRILAHELRGKPDVGDGELHRIASDVIRANRLFDPPIGIDEDGAGSSRALR
jgi:hypothetical protein